MKKFILIIFICLTINTGLIQSASAHVLQTDGSIGAVMHIEPEDDPVVNTSSSILFEIKDTTQKFSSSDCQCIVQIREHNKTVYETAIFTQSDETNPGFSYTFPKKDSYQVVLKGTPHLTEKFQPFTLTYDVTATEKEPKNSAQTAWIHTLYPILRYLSIFIGVVIIIWLVIKGSNHLQR